MSGAHYLRRNKKLRLVLYEICNFATDKLKERTRTHENNITRKEARRFVAEEAVGDAATYIT